MRCRLAAATVVLALSPLLAAPRSAHPPATETCLARSSIAPGASITWYRADSEDAETLDRWCGGVGPPVFVAAESTIAEAPSLEDLVVVSWNAHLAEGRLAGLIDRLRAGDFTHGRPVPHFVLLLQELFRRGPDVPPFGPLLRSAHAIAARDPSAPDVSEYARTLGLSVYYVPSMRNGAELREDRGNAIVTTEPLVDPWALELPFERQRRVAIGAAIRVRTPGRTGQLQIVTVHLEPVSSPTLLWVFHNPRPRQTAALLDVLKLPRFEADAGGLGTVLGGDFNTIQGGANELAYQQARRWSRSLADEDTRSTHGLGRLDYLFFRLAPGWTARSMRLDDRFGSDHHPVMAQFDSRHLR